MTGLPELPPVVLENGSFSETPSFLLESAQGQFHTIEDALYMRRKRISEFWPVISVLQTIAVASALLVNQDTVADASKVDIQNFMFIVNPDLRDVIQFTVELNGQPYSGEIITTKLEQTEGMPSRVATQNGSSKKTLADFYQPDSGFTPRGQELLNFVAAQL